LQIWADEFMITSMTGYGRGSASYGDMEIIVELRSVNNRFLDVSLKLPHTFTAYEQQIRELIGAHISRGRVSVWMVLKGTEETSTNFSVNHSLVKRYLNAARELNEKYGVQGELNIASILALPDVLVMDVEKDADESNWVCARQALVQALEQMSSMRRREGSEIYKDFVARIDELELYVQRMKDLSEHGPDLELSKLKERVKRLIGNEKIDDYRLEMELALISDRIDISEEITRFFSHITLFREMMNEEPSQGRKLNFLLQEMNREANTMASKAFTAEISHLVVKIKEEIEKIREQVQNIE
jgi:uncharacterized protein (TIGR00255 family)